MKNNQLDAGMTLFVGIVAQWIMPLFFILSGVSSYYSLESRKSSRYVGNRFRRLVIPLLFGTLVLLVPVQVWIERVSHAQFDGGFIRFYPHYFVGFYAFGGNFAWMGLHLWYLEVLFIFTLLTFPLFIFCKKTGVQGRLSGAVAFFGKNGAILLLGLPLFLVEWLVNLQPEGVGMRSFGGWSLPSYLIFFVTGFLTAFNLRSREAMKRCWLISSVLGLMTTGLMFFSHIDIARAGNLAGYTLTVFARAFNSWFWLVALLGFGSKFLSFNHEILKYCREAVLPFYILHQTVIVVIGFYIANWEARVMVKYLALSTLSFAVIIALYDLLIKRVNVFRFLFGMKVTK